MIPLKLSFYGLIAFLNYAVGENESTTITIQQGTLTGKIQQSRNGSKYFAFLSIPYAKPPVGELRFKSPEEPEPWGDDIKDATKPPTTCLQKNAFNRRKSVPAGSEDCLYLNVYTPNAGEANLPVMVYIHGGSLVYGYGSQYQPDYILDKPVVLVTFNYRLGLLGFISAVDDVLPGNFGLKDQVAALKWVQKNIAAFGGDPKQVTLFGESAGGTCVDLHLHSLLSKGLFQRAIIQSGSARSFWTHTSTEVARQKAFAVGTLSGCTRKTAKALVKCLRKVPADELVETNDKFLIWDNDPIPFPVVIEDENVEDAFLIKNPWQQEVINAVPVISGITSGEGAFKVSGYLSNYGKLANEINKNYKRLFPILYTYGYWLTEEQTDIATEKLKNFYFGNKSISIDTPKELIDMGTDVYFAYASIESALRHPAPVYYYYYDHKNKISIGQFLSDYKGDLGVCHGDDLLSFFPLVFPKVTNGPDFVVSQRMINYWYNFVKTGDPNEEENLWKPISSNEFEYLHITTEGDKMEKNLLKDRYTFWKNLKIDPIIGSKEEKLFNEEL